MRMAGISEKERKQKLRDIKRRNNIMYRKLNRERKIRIPESRYTTKMEDPENVLEIDNLHTFFYTDIGMVRAVNGVSLNIPKGKTVSVVGESGCGKSVCSLSILRLLQEPQGQIAQGSIRLNMGQDKAVDLVKVPVSYMNHVRGNEITMIFQEPMTTLNPVFSIGRQLDEIYYYHEKHKYNKKQRKERSVEMLSMVGIANPGGVYGMYPHELSGGMRQRVVIAMALACGPKLIIADEPTTALDVTIQAQILDLFGDIKNRISASILLITHDLGVVAGTADIVFVMYAGRIVEQGTVLEIFNDPKHPYTIGLMNSRPSKKRADDRLAAIPGSVPNPIDLPDYCFFRNRCDCCVRACGSVYPPLFTISGTHKVACYKYLDITEGVK